MNKILKIRELAPNVREYVVDAPIVAKHALAGQFIILRVDKDGERVPFTICDYDKSIGSITILVQTVGATTYRLSQLNEGDFIEDFIGPLGNSTDMSHYKRVLLVGGGIGSAVIFPQAKIRHISGLACDVVIGARTKELIMYEEEFRANCDNFHILTDDGSYGEKGFVTLKVEELIKNNNQYDCVLAVGPIPMMRAVCNVTLKYNVHTMVSMNSIMVDGTGMCGGCRLTVGGEVKYACVDGPEFDGHKVDFNEAMSRLQFYTKRESSCYMLAKNIKA